MDKSVISNFTFRLHSKDGSARAGILSTPHGDVETPVFMPVGTQATVKSLTPAQLEELKVQMLLSNTYHLYLRPGAEVIQEFGGLHNFMNWHKPILTDSGGFQVFSLGNLRQVTDEGVVFKSHIDGSTHNFTPESAIHTQEKLGADIIMAFDECPEPHDRLYNEQALERTHQWAERCLRAKSRPDQALFGIVQGGIFPDLRAKSAEYLTSLNFPGYSIGGLSVGESKEDMLAVIQVVNAILPESKPRYLMGVGTPYDLIEGIRLGIDMFDCVLPTRLARHHAAQTLQGRLNLSKAEYVRDHSPIDPYCGCYTCKNFSRSYLRHLIIAKEMLASTLISIHNIFTLTSLARTLRKSILDKDFDNMAAQLLANLEKVK
jgi:queuine tRNA-ribosyltransferase